MTDRASDFMQKIWDARNSGADTEQKLVAEILKITAETVKYFTAQDGRIVLDKDDMLQLSKELSQ